ncbi:unnamed protein product [Rhizoctonia solani]|uniref:Uncharacterized protein n=1 Tax=Rhizoctonia solani TaxID=456999 RepID=A0A8H3ASV2_9AGAM|nr:unnamed protein product [Rhizoctonia solani]
MPIPWAASSGSGVPDGAMAASSNSPYCTTVDTELLDPPEEPSLVQQPTRTSARSVCRSVPHSDNLVNFGQVDVVDILVSGNDLQDEFSSRLSSALASNAVPQPLSSPILRARSAPPSFSRFYLCQFCRQTCWKYWCNHYYSLHEHHLGSRQSASIGLESSAPAVPDARVKGEEGTFPTGPPTERELLYDAACASNFSEHWLGPQGWVTRPAPGPLPDLVEISKEGNESMVQELFSKRKGRGGGEESVPEGKRRRTEVVGQSETDKVMMAEECAVEDEVWVEGEPNEAEIRVQEKSVMG